MTNVFKSGAHLERANIFAANGDFTSALTENEYAIKNPLQIQLDFVLFQRGLIFGHPHNPNRDLNKARSYFQEIVIQYPNSRFFMASQTLILIIDEVLTKDIQIEAYESARKGYLEKIDLQEQHLKAFNGQIGNLTQQIEGLNEQIDSLKQQIEEYKAIDLNIEREKKEKMTNERTIRQN